MGLTPAHAGRETLDFVYTKLFINVLLNHNLRCSAEISTPFQLPKLFAQAL